MEENVLSDIRIYSCTIGTFLLQVVEILKNEIIKQDSVAKQEEQAQSLTSEIQSTDNDLHTQKVLNMQLCTDNRVLITNLSHILNERSRLLIECEGLQNSTYIIQQQLVQIGNQVSAEQEQYEHLSLILKQLDQHWNELKHRVNKQEADMELCNRRFCILFIVLEKLKSVSNSLCEIQKATNTKQELFTDSCDRYELLQKQKDTTDKEIERNKMIETQSEEELMLFQKKLSTIDSVMLFISIKI